MESRPYDIIRRHDGRFIIADAETQEVLDNAQGHGYKTRQNAEKAAWYKFKGGKAKQDAERQAARAFWRQYPAFAKAVSTYYEWNVQEIARGETDPKADLATLADEMGVDGFRDAYVAYLP
jgi:hypothetical protein